MRADKPRDRFIFREGADLREVWVNVYPSIFASKGVRQVKFGSPWTARSGATDASSLDWPLYRIRVIPKEKP